LWISALVKNAIMRQAVQTSLVLILLMIPTLGLACDYPYMASPELFELADAVFIGKVVESPWRGGSNGSTAVTGRRVVRFSVQKVYRGAPGSEITLPDSMTSCSYPFLEGETYVVHSYRGARGLDTGQQLRPLLLADATEAIKYLEAITANRAVGVLYGIAPSNLTLRLRSANGQELQANVKAGYYEIVVPAGEYRAWLEQGGKLFGEPKSVRIVARKGLFERLDQRP
jgi:hypothetical protein